jgi:hypothetical protein
MIPTLSSFYYGHEINASNNKVDFDEGGGELTATIASGGYTLTEFAVALQAALNDTGALTYTVTVDRATRKITIASTSNFELLVSSGTNVGTSAWALAGFTGADKTGASSYLGQSGSGSEFKPSFYLQDFVSKNDWQEAAYGVRNESSSGEIEVVRFGYKKRIQLNIVFQNDNAISSPTIESGSGLTALRSFMQYAIRLMPVEINYDRSTPAVFDKIRLESTASAQDGLGYKLKELYDVGLPDVFETEVMIWRVFE